MLHKRFSFFHLFKGQDFIYAKEFVAYWTLHGIVAQVSVLKPADQQMMRECKCIEGEPILIQQSETSLVNTVGQKLANIVNSLSAISPRCPTLSGVLRSLFRARPD